MAFGDLVVIEFSANEKQSHMVVKLIKIECTKFKNKPGNRSVGVMPPKKITINELEARLKRMEDDLAVLQQENRTLREENQRNESVNTSRGTWQMSSAEAKDAIPKFYPGDGPLMTASNWTKTVEDLMRMYNWESRQVLYYAQTRLRGAAESWFFANREKLREWKDLKEGLQEAFPNTATYASVYQEMLRRTQKKDERLEDYVYDVYYLGSSISLPIKEIVKIVISGLVEENIRSIVMSAKCETIPELIRHIRDVESVIEQNRQRRMI